jgi:N-acetylneuraminic acid mutarotase
MIASLVMVSLMAFLTYPDFSLQTFFADFTEISWTTATPCPYRTAESQGVTVGGKLYVFGGFDANKPCCTPTNKAYRYDPGSNSWKRLANMPPPSGLTCGGLTHAGFTTDGTDIYFAGGYTANSSCTGQRFGTRDVWKYKVATNTYSTLPKLPIERSAGNLEYENGKLHYIGGTNLARTMDVGDHYVLDLNNLGAGWKTLAPLPNPRHHAGSTTMNGKIYIVGGQHKHDGQLTTQDDMHCYNPATNTWTQLADLPEARGHIASATFVHDGRIFVIGGELDHGMQHHVADVLAYKPASNQWSALTPLPTPRASGVARSVGGKLYYATGSWSTKNFKGTPISDGGNLDPIVRYEAETNYQIVSDVGTSAIGVNGGSGQSQNQGVKIYDIGDKIKITFPINTQNSYKLKVRVRAGNSSNSTLLFDKYTYTLDNAPIAISPVMATLSGLESSYGGSYFGTAESGWVSLGIGNHELTIAGTRAFLVVDYLDIETQNAGSFQPFAQFSILKSESELSIYPNPASDFVFISGLKKSANSQNLEIYDSKGNLVKTLELRNQYSGQTKLDLSSLREGVYYLKVDRKILRIQKQAN